MEEIKKQFNENSRVLAVLKYNVFAVLSAKFHGHLIG